MDDELDELITLKEAAILLKCHINTLRIWDKKGILKAVRLGQKNLIRYKRKDIARLLNNEHLLGILPGKKITMEIKKYLIGEADSIQKLATGYHKRFLADKKFRTEDIEWYQKLHRKVVRELARSIGSELLQHISEKFKKIGDTIASNAIRDKLTLQETADGIIFIKQAIWKKMEEQGYIDKLTTRDMYMISQSVGTYCDVIASQINFSYHEYYKKRVESFEKRKDEFVGVVSHELKTPVTSIKAFTQVLERRFAKRKDEASALLLGKMNLQINKLMSLISDLLDITKIEEGKLTYNELFFYFDELVDEIIEEIQRTTKHAIKKEGTTGKTILGDRDRIGQVITNLLTNALKYSPPAKDIFVLCSVDRISVTLCVKDFGIGIPKDKQKKVFERFYRVNDASYDSVPGIGLGLFISAEIIKRQGGKIWVESEQGEGATFFFRLPIRKRNALTSMI